MQVYHLLKSKSMFWKKNPEEILQKKYETLLKEAFNLSKTDRQASDRKTMEAEKVMEELMALREGK